MSRDPIPLTHSSIKQLSREIRILPNLLTAKDCPSAKNPEMTPLNLVVSRKDDLEGEISSIVEFPLLLLITLVGYFVREGRRGFCTLTSERRGEVGSWVDSRTGSEELYEPGRSVTTDR